MEPREFAAHIRRPGDREKIRSLQPGWMLLSVTGRELRGMDEGSSLVLGGSRVEMRGTISTAPPKGTKPSSRGRRPKPGEQVRRARRPRPGAGEERGEAAGRWRACRRRPRGPDHLPPLCPLGDAADVLQRDVRRVRRAPAAGRLPRRRARVAPQEHRREVRPRPRGASPAIACSSPSCAGPWPTSRTKGSVPGWTRLSTPAATTRGSSGGIQMGSSRATPGGWRSISTPRATRSDREARPIRRSLASCGSGASHGAAGGSSRTRCTSSGGASSDLSQG